MACNRYDESDRKFIEELIHMHVRYLSEDFTLQEAFERTPPPPTGAILLTEGFKGD